MSKRKVAETTTRVYQDQIESADAWADRQVLRPATVDVLRHALDVGISTLACGKCKPCRAMMRDEGRCSPSTCERFGGAS